MTDTIPTPKRASSKTRILAACEALSARMISVRVRSDVYPSPHWSVTLGDREPVDFDSASQVANHLEEAIRWL